MIMPEQGFRAKRPVLFSRRRTLKAASLKTAYHLILPDAIGTVSLPRGLINYHVSAPLLASQRQGKDTPSISTR
ncbi:hypothetical protein HYPDE_26228 [Hyphomicrobium denitrificans 1NES1]|uniref:Uncharacterized protein n=1 Tax=Hyphomicrobium denitrificans 1NES1 TaxID=670307 RepID=N0B1V6_9HYPH|nr:hypothetical protein HYPDE_26228 [Hyphomicrobium denitrificans 1NES1]